MFVYLLGYCRNCMLWTQTRHEPLSRRVGIHCYRCGWRLPVRERRSEPRPELPVTPEVGRPWWRR